MKIPVHIFNSKVLHRVSHATIFVQLQQCLDLKSSGKRSITEILLCLIKSQYIISRALLGLIHIYYRAMYLGQMWHHFSRLYIEKYVHKTLRDFRSWAQE